MTEDQKGDCEAQIITKNLYISKFIKIVDFIGTTSEILKIPVSWVPQNLLI